MSSNANTVSSTPATKPAAAAGRPVLKNLGRARVPRAGLIGISIAAVSAVIVKYGICDRHKNQISEFYKSYDPERDYARMKASGVFKSLEGRERPSWLSEYEAELDSAIASLKSA